MISSVPNPPRILYLMHAYPIYTDHYVQPQVEAMRSAGLHVELFAAYRQTLHSDDIEQVEWAGPDIAYLMPLRFSEISRMLVICIKGWDRIRPILTRICFGGRESLLRRIKALGHLLVSAKLAHIATKHGIGHIHANQGYLASHVAMMASKLAGISYSVTLHGSDMLLDKVFLDQKVTNCLFCFTISDFNKKCLLGTFDCVDEGKIIVSRLGVREHCKPDEIIRRRTKRANPVVFLTVGRLAPVKNYTFLIDACALLASRGHQFLCVIIGGGPQEKELCRLIAKRRLESSVKLVGYVAHDNLEPWYRFADYFFLTSKSEGLPLAVMEAMSFGIPVLTPEITGMSELVIREKTGTLYESGSLEDFADKVEGMLASPEKTQQMAENGARFVREKYDLYRNSDEFARYMISMLSEKNTPK